jgi:hypothetical protein
MQNYSFRPNLSFLNKKIDLGFRAKRRGNWRGEEQSTEAQIANAGDIIHALTAPIHPNVHHDLDARSHPSGIGQLCQFGGHVFPQRGRGRAAEKTDDPSLLLQTIVGGWEANNQVKASIVSQDFPDRQRDVFSYSRAGDLQPLS